MEAHRQLFQHGMKFSITSWLLLIVFISFSFLVVFHITLALMLRFTWRTDESNHDYQFLWLVHASAILVLYVWLGLMISVHFLLQRSETLRVYLYTPCELRESSYVLFREVSCEHQRDFCTIPMRSKLIKVEEKDGIRFVQFSGIRYLWNEKGSLFEPCELVCLKNSCKNGLTNCQAEKARLKVGPNSVACCKSISLWSVILQMSTHPIFACAFFGTMGHTMSLHLVVDGLFGEEKKQQALFHALRRFLSTLLVLIGCIFMRWRAQRHKRTMVANQSTVVTVRRDKVKQNLPSAELVPGDVIYLKCGDVVPADASLLNGSVLVDESILTGESDLVAKSPHPKKSGDGLVDELWSGSQVVEGGCSALVTRTGGWSSQGKLLRVALFARKPVWKIRTTLVWLCFGYFIFLQSLKIAMRVWDVIPNANKGWSNGSPRKSFVILLHIFQFFKFFLI